MTFFDKKEEVMKVELTPLGRYRLSIGKLKPHHYRFFDNNIVYDGKAIARTEEQNDADVRIRENTPILKQNPNITGVETSIKLNETKNLEVAIHNVRENTRDDHINHLVYSIGTIEYDATQSPAYQVDAFRGQLSSSTDRFYSSPSIQTSSIPQIDLEIAYSASVSFGDIQVLPHEQDYFYQSSPLSDGSMITIEKRDPLIRIIESSAFDEKENFHITAYKVEQIDGTGPLTYRKMNFDKAVKKISGDLYLGEVPNIEIGESSPDDISYYFEILTDKEIAESDYCATIGDLKIKNIYLDDEIICPDQQQDLANINIYASRVRPEDLEDCD
jgi:hypothetical protein